MAGQRRLSPRAVQPLVDRASPLRGPYLVKHRGLWIALRMIDLVAALLPRRGAAPPARGARVLIAVGGHLGDAVIATSALRWLASARPDAEIGVLAPSWSRAVFDGHPMVARVHELDHWRSSRRPGRLARWRRYRSTRSRAIAELRRAGYHVAVDLYDHFPNAAGVLWASAIPSRVGYRSGGLGPLYSTALPWSDDGTHVMERHQLLLQHAVAAPTADLPMTYALAPVPGAAAARAIALAGASGSYVVMHTGAGDPGKEWPIDRWRAVLDGLATRRMRVILTGQGAAHLADARSLAAGRPDCVELCDQLQWSELVAVVAGARAVLSVDTVVAHLAAAASVPSVIVWSAINDPARWAPRSECTIVLVQDMSSPGEGIANVSAPDVLSALDSLLAPQRPLP
ncbi:MAG: glycosyltransferase family 9 protein [Gemmatimonadaceae bacterium]|nr:glycosyltransferase family 9 protein [Gemmatimonadaceae bacterium]